MKLPKWMEPLYCHCRARASASSDAHGNCRCDDSCEYCDAEPAEGLYNGKPSCIDCATRIEFDPGIPIESPMRLTPEGLLIVNEDALQVAR